jgi:hypothetical protein
MAGPGVSGRPRAYFPRLNRNMPSLFRFLLVVGIIGGIGYGIIFALATFVNPKPREITVTVPADRFYKQR